MKKTDIWLCNSPIFFLQIKKFYLYSRAARPPDVVWQSLLRVTVTATAPYFPLRVRLQNAQLSRSCRISHPVSWVSQRRQPASPPGLAAPPPHASDAPSPRPQRRPARQIFPEEDEGWNDEAHPVLPETRSRRRSSAVAEEERKKEKDWINRFHAKLIHLQWQNSHACYLRVGGAISAVGFSGRQKIMLVMVRVVLTIWAHGWLAVATSLPLSP